MRKVEFEAVVVGGHKEAAVEVPFDPTARWGTQPARFRPGRRGHAVAGKVGRTAFSSHIVARARRFFLLLDASVLARAKASIGDRVEISLAPHAPDAHADPRVDAYIAKAAPFARPILMHLRAMVHAGCPAVKETIKWGMPAFEHHGPLAGMAAFKAHATFGFWKAALLAKMHPDFTGAVTQAMGQFGRITSLRDLPAKRTLVGWVEDAAALNEAGVKVPRTQRTRPRKLTPPADLTAALAKNKAARAGFQALGPSHQNEYIEWLAEAKREATKAKRLATAIAWLTEGKPRNWKYGRR